MPGLGGEGESGMKADTLIEQVRPVLEELASRMRQTELECGHEDALAWALYPMLSAHREGLDAGRPEDIEWATHLAVAIRLVRPGWMPEDISEVLRSAARLDKAAA